jgi:hypothetical protein
MADTVGVLWGAATGTVDPWTKNNIVADGAAGQVKATAGNVCLAKATQQVCQQTTTYLKSIGGDPSQAGCGFKNSVNKFTSDITKVIVTVLIIGIIVIVLMNSASRNMSR